MSTQPQHPVTETDRDTEIIILERLANLSIDKQTAENADVVMKRIRESLNSPKPK